MATRPGNALLNTTDSFADGGHRHDQQHNSVLVTAGAPLTVFVMEAKDSVTLANYNWISTLGPDFAGVGYPGPNSPTLLTITQRRIMVG